MMMFVEPLRHFERTLLEYFMCSI